MGVVNTTYTFQPTDVITSSRMNDIIDQTTMTSTAISGTTLEVTAAGQLKVRAQGITSDGLATDAVTSTKIANGAVTSGKLSTGGPTWDGGTTYITSNLELGTSITVDTPSYIDFHSSPSTDFNARIIRQSGVNAALEFVQTGTSAILFQSPSAPVGFVGAGGISLINGSSNANFPVPAGTAPIYGARAWVNFYGIGTVGANMTIRAGGNVSSVNKTATGVYRVTFATAMPDANYAAIVGSDANSPHKIGGVITQTSGYVDIAYSQINTSSVRENPDWGQVSIFR